MKAWWAGLVPREQRIVLAGLVALVVLFLWLGVWEPLASNRAELRSEVGALSTDLAWMQQVSDQVRRRGAQQRSQSSAGAGGSVLTLIEVSANAAGIKQALGRVQPEGSGARLSFEEVGFDSLVGWLNDLENRHGLQISQLAVDVSSSPGMVSARLMVEPR
ncbi:type II secretion system protein GspM [Pseudomonas sp. OIL-1]|uniref:type II secretion system protein GspM n=1 Tax=Pseudomonas sp. OIL-1 TaxID=2706126 RepID=UPI0013A75373|nr:type II secretion system protein M [Pseudomonas sp. OIL-1]QIB51566.1 type II secretion system protein M [Pseudomonas sp. OIL-1]